MIPSGRVSYGLREHVRRNEAALVDVSKYTHYHPDIWRRRGWNKEETHSAFLSMFQGSAFVRRLHRSLWHLMFSGLARKCVNQSCEFVLATRAEVPGAGDVCGFSTLTLRIMAMISGRDEQLEPKVQIAESLSDP
jgi:hypothetical protein